MFTAEIKYDLDTCQESIFKEIFGETVSLKRKYRNPLRNDNKASCWFWMSPNGLLYFIDPACPDLSGNANQMAKLAGLTELHFNKVNKIYRPSEGSEILVTAKKVVTNEAIQYFKQGNIDLLKYSDGDYKVKQVNRLSINGYVTLPMMCFAYLFPSGRKQIYRPLESKENKWFSNTTKEDVWLSKDFEQSCIDKCVITSSVKDSLTINALGFASIAPKSESTELPYDLLDSLREKDTTVIYDNDETGRKYAKKLADSYGFKVKFTHEKDPFDQVSLHGQESLMKIINGP